MIKYRAILILGPPGIGKSTQGRTLGTISGFFYCSADAVCRLIDLGTEWGAALLQCSSQGQVVPDEMIIRLWQAHLRNCIESHTLRPSLDRLVLDGVPRNQIQARLLQESIHIDQIFHLTGVSPEAMMSRLQKRALQENRLDDANVDVVQRQLKVYQQESAGLLNYYPASLITEIDAKQRPHAVLNDILSALVSKDRVAAFA